MLGGWDSGSRDCFRRGWVLNWGHFGRCLWWNLRKYLDILLYGLLGRWTIDGRFNRGRNGVFLRDLKGRCLQAFEFCLSRRLVWNHFLRLQPWMILRLPLLIVCISNLHKRIFVSIFASFLTLQRLPPRWRLTRLWTRFVAINDLVCNFYSFLTS